MLSRNRIIELFGELNDELAHVGARGDVLVVGGAAMVVAYDARPSTRDVDAVWRPSAEIRAAAERIASHHDDLDADWLNDGVKGLLPGDDPGPSQVVFEGSNLSVSTASPEYLLATKLLASRVDRDEGDVLLLLRVCGLSTVDEGLDLVERFYGKRPIEPKVAYFLEELLARPRPPLEP